MKIVTRCLITFFVKKNYTQNTWWTCFYLFIFLNFSTFVLCVLTTFVNLLKQCSKWSLNLFYTGEVEVVWRTLELWRICFVNRYLPRFLIKNWNFRVYDVTSSCTSSILYSNPSSFLSWFRCYNVMPVYFVDIL